MLIVHRAERADALIGPLAHVVAEPVADAFATEMIAVPTKGVERWLAQRLSHHLGSGDNGEAGICAGVDFTSLNRLMTDVLAQVAGVDPQHDPWSPSRLIWPLLEVIDTHLDQEWARPLAIYLDADAGSNDPEARHGRRLALARRVAGLFNSYATQRPSLILAWRAGSTGSVTGATASSQADSTGTPADLQWQAELWRALRERIGTTSPAERLEDAVRELRENPNAPGTARLPHRLSVFGLTRLPQAQLEVLLALAMNRDVHVWLPHPSPALWDSLAAAPVTSPRRADATTFARLPLLASTGRDVAELQQRLLGQAQAVGVEVVQQHHAAVDQPSADTMLNLLQRAIRADTEAVTLTGRNQTGAHIEDRSVQFHACHGRARQVEVLREVVLGLLAADTTLEARDIVVMCPDVEAFAPLISAAFAGQDSAPRPDLEGLPHPGRQIPVRVADRSLRETNPHLGLVSELLDLAHGRVEATAVLNLVSGQPVRQRFGFSADDLQRIRDWTQQTRVAWGEDETRRARFGLADVAQGTWRVGLDRLLLGVTLAEDSDSGWVGRTLPLDDISSTEIELAGRFSEFIERLQIVLAELTGKRPISGWLATLEQALDWLTAPAPGLAWQPMQARTVLAEIARSVDQHTDVELRLSDLRALLAGRLEGRPTRSGFRTGALTMCSLEPMRSVPHRVIVLLGMDDGTFPRSTSTQGDDILLQEPWLGERDRRSEDRQLFLDALMAAQEHLIVLYSGADERTGAERPPCVPVGELYDLVAQLGEVPPFLVRHPLQPVDARNFTPDELGTPGPFSFDVAAVTAAERALSSNTGPGTDDARGRRHPLLTRPLPVRPSGEAGSEVALRDLIDLLEHPAKWFLRTQLGVWLPSDFEHRQDRIPITLDPLERWAIGDRMLTEALAGRDPREAQQAEYRRGWLPPRRLGAEEMGKITNQIDPVLIATRWAMAQDDQAMRNLEVGIDLPSGTRVVGTVPGVRGNTVLRATNSRLGAKHRLRAWVQALALSANDIEPYSSEDHVWSATTIGRSFGRGQAQATQSRITAPGRVAAAQHLEDLVRLRERARREPLPIPVATAAAYARERFARGSVVQALAAAKTEWRFERMNDDHLTLCWGELADFSVLTQEPHSTERALVGEEGTRLGGYARRIWDPLLAAEEVRTL